MDDLLEYNKLSCMDGSGLWLTRAGRECYMEFLCCETISKKWRHFLL
jgi:hypothetical protein